MDRNSDREEIEKRERGERHTHHVVRDTQTKLPFLSVPLQICRIAAVPRDGKGRATALWPMWSHNGPQNAEAGPERSRGQ
jgi:hypothetical protein